MPADALGRVTVKAIEGFCRQALDAIELEMAGPELVCEARDQPELFILEEAPVPRRKDQHLGAGMAEHYSAARLFRRAKDAVAL